MPRKEKVMFEIVGVRHAKYTNSEGQPREGYQISFTCDYLPNFGEGKSCENCWVRLDMYNAFKDLIYVGAPTMPIYNSRGILQGFAESFP